MDEALDRCAAERYLDDELTAVRYVEELQRRGMGQSRLGAELRRRGASPEAIASSLAALGEDLELAHARAAAAKWRRREGRDEGGADEAARRAAAGALARHLDRKGFSRRAILAVLESAGEAEAELPDGDPVD